MPPVIDPDDEIPEDEEEGYEAEEEEAGAVEHCPICDAAEGECDHLLAAIDLTFYEIDGGTVFAHERAILDMIERLAAAGPDALKVAGASPALVHAASFVETDAQGGMSMGDAVSNNYPQLMEALRYMLEEDGDVTVTEGETDEGSGDSRAYANLWSEDADGVVARLTERLQGWLDELE